MLALLFSCNFSTCTYPQSGKAKDRQRGFTWFSPAWSASFIYNHLPDSLWTMWGTSIYTLKINPGDIAKQMHSLIFQRPEGICSNSLRWWVESTLRREVRNKDRGYWEKKGQYVRADFLPLDMWHFETHKPMAAWVKGGPVFKCHVHSGPHDGHWLCELSLYRIAKFTFL